MNTILSIAILALALALAVCLSSCSKNDPVLGCTDSNALNYDSAADIDDGSCTFN
ncbi:MAG: hypothetical protein HRT57_02505 [Crocinitomicaceae bacterium]|nr:hypothetical protein [Crocinitomicaceae bacterium]